MIKTMANRLINKLNMRPHKSLLFITTILLFAASHNVLALEIEYPEIFGVKFVEGLGLQNYILYIFLFIIVSAGGIGVLSVAIGGLQILLNFGRPEAVSAARKRIFDAILGIVLLMSSVITLRTINPELIKPAKSVFLGLAPGVYISMPVPVDEDHPAGVDYRRAPGEIADTSSFGIGAKLVYRCDPPGPTLLVSQFTYPNFLRGPHDQEKSLECNGLSDVAFIGGSLKRQYKDTGVYFYPNTQCMGVSTCESASTCAKKTDGSIPFFDDLRADQTVRSFRIVSGLRDDEKYGVILSWGSDSTECTVPFINISDRPTCFNVPVASDGLDFNPSYAYIIYPNPFYETSGRGVALQSKNLEVDLSEDDIGFWIWHEGNPDEVLLKSGYIYTRATKSEIERSRECQPNDPNAPCLKNVIPLGSYYLVLYAQSDLPDPQGNYNRICKLFRGGINELKASNADLLPDDYSLHRMDIIPASLE